MNRNAKRFLRAVSGGLIQVNDNQFYNYSVEQLAELYLSISREIRKHEEGCDDLSHVGSIREKERLHRIRTSVLEASDFDLEYIENWGRNNPEIRDWKVLEAFYELCEKSDLVIEIGVYEVETR